MEKSFYFDYVQKYFPQLVISVVERLNGQRVTRLPYLYRDLLTPRFTADTRWASVLAEYTRVAADVVSLGSELPLKSRDTIETAHGDIPKIGMKLALSEKEMKDIDAMLAQPNLFGINQVVQTMFADVPRVIEGVYERIEDLFLSELSTGVGLSTRNDGKGVRIDVGYYASNQFTSTAPWASATTVDIEKDIQQIFDKAIEDNNSVVRVFADDTALQAMYKNEKIRGLYAFDQGFSGATANIPVLDLNKLQTLFRTKWGVELQRVYRKTKTEINGKKQNHSAWKQGMMTFVCDTDLGTLVYTNCAEQSRPVAGVAYQVADDYILASRYSTNDPLQEITASQAMVVPIINNVDRIYTLDTTVTAG